jgi:hypothetical protein
VGYKGAKLANIFPREPAGATARRIAEEGGRVMTDRAAAHSPTETGALKDSWHQTPLHHRVDIVGHRVYVSGTRTELEYAPYVEYGTGLWGPKHAKYPIRPKNPDGFLHFFWKKANREVWFKMVMHPGSPGRHMLADAVRDTEALLPLFGHAEVELWVAEMKAVLEAEAAAARSRIAA